MEENNDKIIVDKSGVPSGFNLIGWSLSYKAYTYLVAIANYSNSFSGSRAKFYLSADYSVEEKSRCRDGEGSFMSAILQGDFLQAYWNADLTNRAALIESMSQGEIEIPQPSYYYKIAEKERARNEN